MGHSANFFLLLLCNAVTTNCSSPPWCAGRREEEGRELLRVLPSLGFLPTSLVTFQSSLLVPPLPLNFLTLQWGVGGREWGWGRRTDGPQVLALLSALPILTPLVISSTFLVFNTTYMLMICTYYLFFTSSPYLTLHLTHPNYPKLNFSSPPKKFEPPSLPHLNGITFPMLS